MPRYDYFSNIARDTNKGNSRVYLSLYYPEIPTSDSDVYIIANEADRLDLLAQQYYGDVNNWWIIAHANHINGTFYLNPGDQIRIPMDVAATIQAFKDINNAQ